jgi:hypothetical protein
MVHGMASSERGSSPPRRGGEGGEGEGERVAP